MNNYSVYKHTNKENGKVYIGMTLQKPLGRWKNGNGYHSKLFREAIEKYGWDGFEHEIIATNLSKQEAAEMERLLIKSYKSNNSQFGYNYTQGGDNGGFLNHSHSETTKQKISHTMKTLTFTDEHRKRISDAKSGVNHHFAKKVYQYTKDDTFIKEWDYMGQAAKELNINKGNIAETCNGNRKSAGGFIWKYERT